MAVLCPKCGSKAYKRSDTKTSYRCNSKDCLHTFTPDEIESTDTITETQEYEQQIATYAIDDYCKEHRLDRSKVSSYRFVNHQGQEKFNVAMHEDHSEKSYDEFYDKLKADLLAETTPVKFERKDVCVKRGFFAWTSDKHVGAHTPETSLYPNEYNEEVFRTRLFKLLAEIEESARIFGRFDKIVFADLGDPLDGYNGQTSRGGHHLPQNMTNEEQFDVYIRVHREFFDRLVELNAANNIQFEAVSDDNHSASFGYCANRALEVYLNVKYPNIQTRITKKFIDHFSYGIHTLIFTHGKDHIDRKHGLPLVLDEKTENFINDYINAKDLRGCLHFMKGDLHQSSVQFGKRFRYKNVLSLYGSSKWIQNNFGNNSAGVDYEIIEKDSSKVYSTNFLF